MKKERLNGYWRNKTNPKQTIYVEKVFKKGYVTGFKYTNTATQQIIGQLKITHEELLDQYVRTSK